MRHHWKLDKYAFVKTSRLNLFTLPICQNQNYTYIYRCIKAPGILGMPIHLPWTLPRSKNKRLHFFSTLSITSSKKRAKIRLCPVIRNYIRGRVAAEKSVL